MTQTATSPRPAPTPAATPPRRPPRAWAWTAAVAATVLVGLLGWFYAWPREPELWTVRREALAVILKGPGNVDAIDKAGVSSRIAGQITAILVDRNDAVRRGQAVATVEQDDLRSIVAATRANLEAAASAQSQARADVVAADAGLANARASFDRQTALRAGGWVPQASLDLATATLKEGEAKAAAAREAVRRADAQARAAAAALAADQARLAPATVRAPFDGIVANRLKSVGDVLSPGAQILEIVDPRTLVVTARFDESAMGQIRPGQAAQIHLAHARDQPLAGRVLRLSRRVDPETREFTADIVPLAPPPRWALDERAEIRIVLAVEPAVAQAPARFIARRDGQAGVWVVKDGRAGWRRVAVGTSSGEMAAIRQGLAQGEVVADPRGAYAFMPVRAPRTAP